MKAPGPSRWRLWYALTLAGLVALGALAAARLPDYRRRAFDFYAMPPGEYFNAVGLTRRQGGSLKLGFAEAYAPPPVGAFGNHILNYFGADAFGAPERGEYFFNYAYANLSLPETLVLLRHIDARGRLPTRLIVVAVTPPNADNGGFIIDHGEELPPDLALEDALRPGASSSAGEIAGALWQTGEIGLHEAFNYTTLILGLTQAENASRLTGPSRCARAAKRAAPPRWIAALPWTLRSAIDPAAGADVCDPLSWVGAFRRDGSVTAPLTAAPVRNEDALRDGDRKLHAGDETEIAAYLRAIDALGRRRGVKVVFLIPPVFETDRRGSVVNQVMDRALALAPQADVIDDRALRADPTMFVSYLHPSPKYFASVAQRLRARGLAPPLPGQTGRSKPASSRASAARSIDSNG